LPHLTNLPDGCFLLGDVSKNNTIDVRTCGKSKCVNDQLHDNGSCADYWPHHCCQADRSEIVDIQCEGFSYKMSRLVSCVCAECRFVTTVSGRAYGRDNGAEIPLQMGEVRMGGHVVTRTNMGGFFRFEVPLGTTRVVVMFSDPVFQRLLDTTKIVQVTEGEETFFTAILPLMPEPVPFDSTNGTEVSIGEGPNGLSAVGSLEIAKNSLTDSNGNPFVGRAAVKLHYTDPRSMDSIDEANGRFETESDSGEVVPLSTYGVLSLALQDENGNSLHANKPVRISINSDAFNIPLDSNGNPEANIWVYDHNKGTWVDKGQFHSSNEEMLRGKRHLLQSGFFFIDSMPSNIPPTKLNDTKTVIETRPNPNNVYNIDYRVPVVVNTPKEGACFVGVAVYSDPFYQEAYSGHDAMINVYVYDNDKRVFASKDSTTVLTNGHACLKMFCDKNITISVERGSEKFIARPDQYVPLPLAYTRPGNEYVNFHAIDFGGALHCGDFYKPETAKACYGPVYDSKESAKCSRASALGANFMFQFAAPSKPPTRLFIVGEQTYDKRLSWYPQSPSSNRFRACFIKLRVKVSNVSKMLCHMICPMLSF